MKKAVFTIIALIVLATGLSACNTVEGAGRDIEGAGEWIQEKF